MSYEFDRRRERDGDLGNSCVALHAGGGGGGGGGIG